jgi:hypothetical protein
MFGAILADCYQQQVVYAIAGARKDISSSAHAAYKSNLAMQAPQNVNNSRLSALFRCFFCALLFGNDALSDMRTMFKPARSGNLAMVPEDYGQLLHAVKKHIPTLPLGGVWYLLSHIRHFTAPMLDHLDQLIHHDVDGVEKQTPDGAGAAYFICLYQCCRLMGKKAGTKEEIKQLHFEIQLKWPTEVEVWFISHYIESLLDDSAPGESREWEFADIVQMMEFSLCADPATLPQMHVRLVEAAVEEWPVLLQETLVAP